MSIQIIAPIRKKPEIERIARQIRQIFGPVMDTPLDVVNMYEWGMPKLDEGYNYHIEKDESMLGMGGVKTKEGLVVLSQTTYENALLGCGDARYTIAHELGHYCLHPADAMLYRSNQRSAIPQPIHPDSCPEYQADAFADELMMPREIVMVSSLAEVVSRCGVSVPLAMRRAWDVKQSLI